MPNQKISELTAIVTVDNSVDVLPIVDISANTTKKVTPNALKTALALDNVNNTSDANKPVSTAQQDALNAKVDENAPIVAATKTKITYDAKGLVTAGDILDAADMPTGINAANIGTGVVSSTEFGYLDGVTSAIQTQLNAKQATLVSGTNIKTINSTSLLGSGDITISANPSGVSGAIQFSNGSAFASDAANLFWDDTNNRLGVGTNNPLFTQQVLAPNNSTIAQFATAQNGLKILDGTLLFGASTLALYGANVTPSTSNYILQSVIDVYTRLNGGQIDLAVNGTSRLTVLSTGSVGIGETNPASARLQVKGSGSTSATTSLLVQNSSSVNSLQLKDNGDLATYGSINIRSQAGDNGGNIFTGATENLSLSSSAYGTGSSVNINTNGVIIQRLPTNANAAASAVLDIRSTTQGFLPPRMTTTQKNAIASPAAGLVVYDSTTNKLCCYNGSTWNDLF